MKIAIGADHAGFNYKREIFALLQGLGHEVIDFGTDSSEPVDYPDLVRPVAEAVARGEFDRGIVLGGSGNGEAMVANKVPGIRCALCWSTTVAKLARLHNNANMLSLGERVIALETAKEVVRAFLETPYEGGRHDQRLEKMAALERLPRHD